MLASLTLTLCGNMCTELLCSHKGLGLGQGAFKTIFKYNNPVCNLHTMGKCYRGLYFLIFTIYLLLKSCNQKIDNNIRKQYITSIIEETIKLHINIFNELLLRGLPCDSVPFYLNKHLFSTVKFSIAQGSVSL